MMTTDQIVEIIESKTFTTETSENLQIQVLLFVYYTSHINWIINLQ